MDLLQEDVLTNWVQRTFTNANQKTTVQFAIMITVTTLSFPKKDCHVISAMLQIKTVQKTFQKLLQNCVQNTFLMRSALLQTIKEVMKEDVCLEHVDVENQKNVWSVKQMDVTMDITIQLMVNILLQQWSHSCSSVLPWFW